MGASFTKFKDRIWFAVDAGTKSLATAPVWVQNLGYGIIEGILMAAYALPGGPLRPTAKAFSVVVDQGPPRRLYKKFVRNFTIGLRKMEILRLGRTAEIDPLLSIPEAARLERVLSRQKGVVLVMPHCHASVLMVRALASRYPVLMLIRGPASEARAKAQSPYYQHIGCDTFNVRVSNDAQVARAVFKALRAGKIVVGVVDRVNDAPSERRPIKKRKDSVRAITFGQPAGFVGWPARFAERCNSTILPAMIQQSGGGMTLHLGAEITPEDTLETTQKWVSELETLCRAYPTDWGFVYDKYWARIMQDQAKSLSEKA